MRVLKGAIGGDVKDIYQKQAFDPSASASNVNYVFA